MQCPKLQELRSAVWPEETSLQSKLYGSRQELQKTAHFIVTDNRPASVTPATAKKKKKNTIQCIQTGFEELDGSPEYEKMISEAEQHRLSRGSADGSVGSPHDPQALDSDDFVNKVCKFEMISRGKSATSPTAKSPPATSSGSGVKYGGYTSSTYMGEKVFSRDTATTRVPAAVLGGSGERVISTCSSLSSSSLTSVSTLNCSSDSSGSNRSLASPPITPQGSIVGGEGSTSSKDDSSDTSSHRNTFEGIDFDVTQMTESEQELARRHREIVAERKREQEQEKMERQRLEEILRMCAEYQQEVDVKPGTKAQGKAHATNYTSTATSSTAPAKTKRGAPPPAFLDLAPGSDQVDHNQKAGANVSGGSAKSLEVTAGDGERKISGDFRANVTKIKTNGSLMLSSPSNPHKEGLFGFQMRRAESNSSTSEDEMLGSSEDTVNSDTEPAEGDGDAFRRASTEGQHLSNGVEAHHGADSLHLRMKEQSELSHQLEVLKKTKTQLLQKIAALKRQITDIETQENEAIREEQRAIERERDKLLMLEERQHQIIQQMQGSDDDTNNSFSSSPTTPVSLLNPTAGASELATLRESLQRELENQRRIFDDLEFQQLEAEARFEEEKERISQKLMQDQQQLLVKYKAREDRLQHIDTQQRDMLHNVKTNLEGLERERLQLIDTFKKEKQAAAEVQQKIVELSRMLSLPTVDPSDDPAALNSDIELEEQADGPRKLFIDSTVLTRTETDAASDTSGGGGSSSGAGVEGGSDNGGFLGNPLKAMPK
nr:hypothetical protein BaRGS_003673 [Batillaria attramentaria]